MDDLISRQAAIDECYPITVDGEVYEVVQVETLMGLPSVQPEPMCVAKVTLTDEQVKEAFEKAKGEILTVLDTQPETNYSEIPNGWIPVTERLPEDGLYLVTTSKGQVQVHVFSHNGNSEEYWMRCNKAWMPLPEPYREEGKDEADN